MRRHPSAFVAAALFGFLLLRASSSRADDRDITFADELRLEGFYGAQSSVYASGLALGPHLGVHLWAADTFGIEALGGAELGILFPADTPSGTIDSTGIFSAELGPIFSIGGRRESGATLSLTWAPHAFVNFSGGQVSSPVGFQVSLRLPAHLHMIKIPLWFVSTQDGTTFFGTGASLVL